MKPERPRGFAHITDDAWQQWMLFQNIERTDLSNERTLLAWVRTSLALITLGFVVERFDLFLAKLTGSEQAPTLPEMVRWLPVVFFALGGVIIALAAWEFFRNRVRIHYGRPSNRLELRDAMILVIVGFVLVVSVLFLLARPG